MTTFWNVTYHTCKINLKEALKKRHNIEMITVSKPSDLGTWSPDQKTQLQLIL